MFTKKISAALGAGILALAGMVGCSHSEKSSTETSSQGASQNGSQSAEKPAEAWPRIIETVDGKGAAKKVTIEKKPERIVSASVTLTGSLLAIDAPVVGSGGGQASSPIFSDQEGFANQWAKTALDRNVKPLYQLEPSAEKILAQNPDLVVMSNVGQDNATAIHDQLASVVPVLVVDYSNQSWEQITDYLGKATGRESKGKELIDSFDQKVAKAAKDITLPPQPANLVSLSRDGGMNFFTTKSAQGQLLEKLGFDVATPPENLVGTTAQGGNRDDIKGVNKENIPLALQGNTVFVMNLDAGKPADEQVRTNPALAQNPAITGDRVVGFAPETFRLDYYSATQLVDFLVGKYA